MSDDTNRPEYPYITDSPHSNIVALGEHNHVDAETIVSMRVVNPVYAVGEDRDANPGHYVFVSLANGGGTTGAWGTKADAQAYYQRLLEATQWVNDGRPEDGPDTELQAVRDALCRVMLRPWDDDEISSALDRAIRAVDHARHLLRCR